jgi:dUTP pyrophosphatase
MTRWLKYKKVRKGTPTPKYQTDGSAGFDVCAVIDKELIIYSGQIQKIPTGLAVQVPNDMFEVQVRPRSGLACNYGVTVVNSPGTVDSDYRGEVKVGLINLSNTAYTIKPGERIAQLVMCPVHPAILKEVAHLESTKRGSGGFGSTGRG